MRQSLFLSLFVVGTVFADRALILVPMQMETVHGGRMINGTGELNCVTADLVATPGASPANQGVGTSTHKITLTLVNVSAIDQTVTLSVESGTEVKSANSNGNATSVAKTPGPNLKVTSAKSRPSFLVPAGGGAKDYQMLVNCSKNECWIADSLESTAVVGRADLAACPAVGACPVSETQVCLLQASNIKLKLTVKEDKGALLGHVATSATRCCGLKDQYLQPPATFSVNGGRPF